MGCSIKEFYYALFNKTLGHRLQLMPFFLYLLQHLLFGVMQFAEHTLSQIDAATKGFIFVFSV
jgi:hypothetical protein